MKRDDALNQIHHYVVVIETLAQIEERVRIREEVDRIRAEVLEAHSSARRKYDKAREDRDRNAEFYQEGKKDALADAYRALEALVEDLGG